MIRGRAKKHVNMFTNDNRRTGFGTGSLAACSSIYPMLRIRCAGGVLERDLLPTRGGVTPGWRALSDAEIGGDDRHLETLEHSGFAERVDAADPNLAPCWPEQVLAVKRAL